MILLHWLARPPRLKADKEGGQQAAPSDNARKENGCQRRRDRLVQRGVPEEEPDNNIVHPQLYKWISKFIPTSQFGFLKGVGSSEYGCTLLFKMLSVLERRGEGILISLDVKGAFDRVWWEMLVAKMEARGLEDDALELIKDYLFKRFLRVVRQADQSTRKEIFSGVPQGAVWSPDFWDFDIADIPTVISIEGDDFEYADDCGLWYEIDDDNRDVIVSIINIDLQSLIVWGQGNLTTFEPEKITYKSSLANAILLTLLRSQQASPWEALK